MGYRSIGPIYGKGVSEIGKYPRFKDTPEYVLWLSMLLRCYNTKRSLRNKTYDGCQVSEDFCNYQFFAEWCNKQVGYGVKGFQLDKDILQPGNKVYCAEVCVFIPRQINALFNSHSASRGTCVQGVTKGKNSKGFLARININGNPTKLGVFKTEKQAELVYMQAKNKYVYSWADRLDSGEFIVDRRVVEALRKFEHKSQLNN